MLIHDQDESNALYNNMLDKYYFRQMQFNDSAKSVEIVFSPRCNLRCAYCYVRKQWPKHFGAEMFDPDKALANAKKILRWMTANGIRSAIDIFSGELFAQESGFALLDVIHDYYAKQPPPERIGKIMIPSNFTFICDGGLTRRVEGYIDRFADIGIRLILSASFDGKRIESSRPPSKSIDIDIDPVRDDAYYDRLFGFLAKHRFGSHPMIYSKAIDKWKDNFLWHEEMNRKHGIGRDGFYLLSVRNAEWSSKDLAGMYDFVRFLVRYDYERHGQGDVNRYLEHMMRTPHGGYNILRSYLFASGGRLSCAIQSSIVIRAADLKIFPCHRTMYEHMQIAHMEEDSDGNIGIVADKALLGCAINGADFQKFPVCVRCPVKRFCVGPCLGSNYETNANLFVPIPTVCKLHARTIQAIMDGLDEIGATAALLGLYDTEKARDYLILKEALKGVQRDGDARGGCGVLRSVLD